MLLHRTIQNNGINLNNGAKTVCAINGCRVVFLADFASGNGSRLCLFVNFEGPKMASTWATPADSHSLTLVRMTPQFSIRANNIATFIVIVMF